MGQIINVLAANAEAKAEGRDESFVPFRNSTLTRMLQDSLGGNSNTMMFSARGGGAGGWGCRAALLAELNAL